MISKKCDYALRAMLELAVREGKGPVTIGDIAQARSIPVRFLEAILRQLKQAGLADSARGKEGGYFLARPAHRLSVSDVIDLFEVSVGAQQGRRQDVLAALWTEADAAMQSVFRRTTFGDLVEREQHLRQNEAVNFSI